MGVLTSWQRQMGFLSFYDIRVPCAYARATDSAGRSGLHAFVLELSCVRLRVREGIAVVANQGKAQEGFDRYIGRAPIALSQVLSPAGTRYGLAFKGKVRLREHRV
jgi:hypothetical protein